MVIPASKAFLRITCIRVIPVLSSVVEDIKITVVVNVGMQVSHVNDWRHILGVAQDFDGLISYHPHVRIPALLVRLVVFIDNRCIHLRSLREKKRDHASTFIILIYAALCL